MTFTFICMHKMKITGNIRLVYHQLAIAKILIRLENIFKLQLCTPPTLQEVLDNHNELSTLKDHKVKFYLEDQAKSKFLKTRSLLASYWLYMIMLQRIYWIDYKNCSYQIFVVGHPLMPVIKSDGSIRNCGDFKKTINKSARTEVYQLATMNK